MTGSGDDLTIVVPLWKRTANLDRLVCSVIDTVPEAEVVFVVSMDDDAVLDPVDQLRRDLFGSLSTGMLPVDWPGGSSGDYARKINAGYRLTDRRFIFTGADDIVFQPGWYDAAVGLARWWCAGCVEWHPNDIGVVGTNDLANPRVMAGEHSTHSLVARWYADQGGSVGQAGMIYHEGYEHEYCDDELVQTAMARGAWAMALDSHVQHMHPINPALDVPDDETYQRGRSRTRISRVLYSRRSRLWRQ